MLSGEKMKDFSIKEKVCISAQVQPTYNCDANSLDTLHLTNSKM